MQSMASQQQNFSQFSPMGSYDHHSTPRGGESSDENEIDYDGDAADQGFSVPLGDDADGAPLQQPTFQDLLSQFTPHPTFTQLLSQPSQQPPQSNPKGKKSWDLIEDIALISSVMNVSTNQKVGTNQRLRVMWGKVVNAYEEARAERPQQIAPRTPDMIKSRWGRVAPPILRWAGCYDEAVRRKRSGQQDGDVIQEAHMIHERKWGKFNLIEQWKILKKFNKWKELASSTQENPRGRRPNHSYDNIASVGSGSSGKRSRTEDDVPDPDTPTSEPQGGCNTRPEGVKKAKSRMTGKMVADEAVHALQSFGQSLRINSEARGKHDELEKEKLEIQRQKEARKQKQLELEEYRMNWDIYQQLTQKENRLPWEDEMLIQLTNYFQNYKRY